MNLPIVLITIFQVLGAAISLYSLLIVVRIMMTWFTYSPDQSEQRSFGQAGRIIEQLTEPYLNLFRGIPWLRTRTIDFSPLAALLTLQILSVIFLEFARRGRIAIGILLGVTVDALIGTVTFLGTMIIIISVVRVIAFYLKISSLNQFWYSIDNLLQPMITPLVRKLFPRRILPYGTALMLFTSILIIVVVVLRLLSALLVPLLIQLPF
jgi:YggT family protein